MSQQTIKMDDVVKLRLKLSAIYYRLAAQESFSCKIYICAPAYVSVFFSFTFFHMRYILRKLANKL